MRPDDEDAETPRLQPPTSCLLYWAEQTASVPFETGIQRVVRNLVRCLRMDGITVLDAGWNPITRLMRVVPQAARDARAYADLTTAGVTFGDRPWLLIPEIPIDVLAAGLDPVNIGHLYGFRTAAIVHDLIPIKLASAYPADVVHLYQRYYRSFAEADVLFTTTRLVAEDLRAYLAAQSLRVPDIHVCPLPAQFAAHPRLSAVRPTGSPLKLLTVSTWEPRKNHLRLLRALRACRSDIGEDRLRLTVVGRQAAWTAYNAEVQGLAESIPGVETLCDVGDAELLALYADHDLSLYPSIEEGFGLPVLESLWLATPCVCHNASSMAEIAPGGGAMMIDMTDEDAIGAVLRHLVEDPTRVDRLAAEAIARPLDDWSDYARAIVAGLDL